MEEIFYIYSTFLNKGHIECIVSTKKIVDHTHGKCSLSSLRINISSRESYRVEACYVHKWSGVGGDRKLNRWPGIMKCIVEAHPAL